MVSSQKDQTWNMEQKISASLLQLVDILVEDCCSRIRFWIQEVLNAVGEWSMRNPIFGSLKFFSLYFFFRDKRLL